MKKLIILWILIFSLTHVQAKVNINTAAADTLQKLPHIGAVKARAIVEYRHTHGAFQRKEDLTKVKGIGPKIYEKLKNEISVDEHLGTTSIADSAKTTHKANKAITYRAAKPITQPR
ncbi:helix-hairpin-helix domain-containing protein [Neisseriaceae bacterium ESL0693]|nr:helix-hairpin-helix domain-containing protein [Neisseriaceae bacterium ESL0693]